MTGCVAHLFRTISFQGIPPLRLPFNVGGSMAYLGIPQVLLLIVVAVPAVGSQAIPPAVRDSWLIDCGGNSNVTTPDGLTFEGDGPYIRTGVSRQVPAAIPNERPVTFATLREFPRAPWKKNCYRIPVEQRTKVLVRTRHYYGNYDGQNSPPQFGVRFDNSVSCLMSTSSTLNSTVFCEAVLVTTEKQGMDICLLRTQPDQSPFVSDIVVRRLQPDMYRLLDFSSYSLFMTRRFAFGANQTIGYPDDAYNRYWVANDLQGIEAGAGKAVILRSESNTTVNTSRITEAPPALLFNAAVVAPMVENVTAGSLTIRTSWLPSVPSRIYFTMYYAELASQDVTQSQNRTFQVQMDGRLLNSTVIFKAETGVAKKLSGSMFRASSTTTFDLVPAQGSTLPPAISGMEVFLITAVSNATDSNDVEALSKLQGNFTLLQNWTGDPCRPTGYSWEWVGCKYPNTSSPRINKLLLRGYQLSGVIPNFSSLDALDLIDLSNNSFTGAVPEFLASFPNPLILDLSDNDFDSIPRSLCNNKDIILITKGNPKLPVPDPCSSGLPRTAPTSAPPVGACNKVQSSNLFLFVISVLFAMV